MRTLFVLIAAFPFLLQAREVIKDTPVASPDGNFQALVVQTKNANTTQLEIKDRSGRKLYSSPSQLDGADIAIFFADHLRWSPDSSTLAVATGFPKLFLTCLFVWDGSTFHQIPLPALAEGLDNPGIYPTKWTDSNTLHLEIKGPMTGKAGSYSYTGEAVIKVDGKTRAPKKLNENITDHYSDDSAK